MYQISSWGSTQGKSCGELGLEARTAPSRNTALLWREHLQSTEALALVPPIPGSVGAMFSLS